MNELLIIGLAGFATGITTVLFGFGGGFVVVPFVYQLLSQQPLLAAQAMHIAVATSTAVMIFNAGWASYQNWRAGKLHTDILLPLIRFIALGAVIGSWLAGMISDTWVRRLFMVYMVVTIADCLLRKGFFSRAAPRRLSRLTASVGGTMIGVIAAMLGVGGSVMTVPLLRRHGYAMRDCVSAANPLSLPVAILGATTYAISGWQQIPASGYLGFISLKILLLLVVAGFLGFLFARRCIPAVPDVWHARIYVLLLCMVLVAIAV
ncbi:sulfite exporter TauE/SafE family protein [Pantoea sp. DY-5]|uniref:sulfite exporter TauE/SafE family protein n=1 Tax=Pantoea sp. DY-5 TaxID=2871488 RepID=UPI001C97EC9F|nr:sulfite exporter TauE/SafE family protein [Pantoea sp. DY-5]MBY4840325.1 sulfite exporter TauE/SafE family protein [Pantoea sp. DY-5]